MRQQKTENKPLKLTSCEISATLSVALYSFRGVESMALTAGRWFGVVIMVDTGNQRTTRRVELDSPLDDAAARAAMLAFVTDLAAVSDCVVASYHVYQEFIEDALTLPAAAQLENQALLTFSIVDEPTKAATFSIPAPKIGIFAGATGEQSNTVDAADTDLEALVANFTSEDLLLVSDGEQADALVRGRRRHVKKTFG